MAEQIGVIIENNPDGMSRVFTSRQRARGGCLPNFKCNPVESHAVNAIAAGVGDVVKLSLPQAGLFKGVGLIYVLPIIALLVGAFVGLWLGTESGWTDVVSVLGALGGLGVGLGTVKLLGRSWGLRRKATPVITEIVKASE
jgi:positive regulator of sigma E activity